MAAKLSFAFDARDQLKVLAVRNTRVYKKVLKCLARLEQNPKHPALHSHRYESLDQIYSQRMWESYVENRTPGAYRLFWHYGPNKDEITIIAITPHP